MIPMLEFLGRVAEFSVVVRAAFHGCGVEGHIVYANGSFCLYTNTYGL